MLEVWENRRIWTALPAAVCAHHERRANGHDNSSFSRATRPCLARSRERRTRPARRRYAGCGGRLQESAMLYTYVTEDEDRDPVGPAIRWICSAGRPRRSDSSDLAIARPKLSRVRQADRSYVRSDRRQLLAAREPAGDCSEIASGPTSMLRRRLYPAALNPSARRPCSLG